MTRIGLISDTHSYLDETVFEHFKNCDEIWHAGDFGSMELVNKMKAQATQSGFTAPNGLATQSGFTAPNGLATQSGFTAPNGLATQSGLTIRGVYGNIDGNDIRAIFPEKLHFIVEGVNVFIQHIGGYPNKYAPGVKDEIIKNHVKLFISGHSHILKIMYDDKLNCLHMNPGAAGKQGWQKVRTLIRFVIDGEDMKDCEVIEL